MSELEVLKVKNRDTFGKRRIRRLRDGGLVPANLYGHGQAAVSISVDAAEVGHLIRHGHHIVNLQGDVQGEALVKEVQWNTWGTEILHIDFARIDVNEKVQLTVPVVLKGDAPGLREGGVVEQLIHEVVVECSAVNVPDEIIVRVNELNLNEHITQAEVALPEGVTVDLAGDTLMVHCVEKREELPEEAADATGAEPEVIARKKEEEAEDK